MRGKTTFIFLIHFHQPPGQNRRILERIQKNSYELLLRVFESYPDLRLTLHFSGPLLLYWREYYPDYLERLRKLIANGKIEVLGGTFGESVLSIIPWDDRLEQLIKGKELVKELLGVDVKGAWLPERVWDPTLPVVLEKAGYKYVILDDEVGYRAGLWKGDVHRAMLTEYSGSRVGVFFIDGPIRYILPWRSHTEVFDYLRSFSTGDGVEYVLWGSDAEKFGEWWDPRPAETWLRVFLSLLRETRDVELLTPSEYLKRHGFSGLVYLYPGSYDKMMEWSGGYFPNFLRKYRESNNMHKKMLYVRRKLKELDVFDKTWKEYFLGQANDAYWHGLFGGIYIASLRQGIYEHLIRAERIAESEGKYFLGEDLIIKELDFDYDGNNEIIVEAPLANYYIKPDDGGTLFEFDIKSKGKEFNLINSMSRYSEPYLRDVGNYHPDWYRRVSFREHIWREGANIWDWVNNTPFVDTSDFALSNYIVESIGKNFVRLVTTGHDWGKSKSSRLIAISKTYRFLEYGKVLEVEYRWRNLEKVTIFPRLSIELTLSPRLSYKTESLPWYTVDNEYNKSVLEHHISPWSKRVTLHSVDFDDIFIENEKHGELWISPITTISRSEKGLRNEYQALGIVFNHQVSLKPGEEFGTKIRIWW